MNLSVCPLGCEFGKCAATQTIGRVPGYLPFPAYAATPHQFALYTRQIDPGLVKDPDASR